MDGVDGVDGDGGVALSADAALEGVGLRKIFVRLFSPGDPGLDEMGDLKGTLAMGVEGVSTDGTAAGRWGSGCWIGPRLCDLGGIYILDSGLRLCSSSSSSELASPSSELMPPSSSNSGPFW